VAGAPKESGAAASSGSALVAATAVARFTHRVCRGVGGGGMEGTRESRGAPVGTEGHATRKASVCQASQECVLPGGGAQERPADGSEVHT
jgi:hypothetical protein